MVFYVVYRAPKESKSRSTLPKRLRALGCQHVHRAFWRVDRDKVPKVLKVLENNKPLLLKRLREIRKPRYTKKKGLTGLGSLIIVMFSIPKEVQRERLKNFFRRAPTLRLRRSVHAFSHVHSNYDKEQKLADAQKCIDFIKEIQGDVKTISRVIIADRNSAEILLKETRERVENEVFEIVSSCKELYSKVLKGNDLSLCIDRFSRIKRRFLILKRVTAFYEGWFKMDFGKSLMRAYHALRKVNSVIKKK